MPIVDGVKMSCEVCLRGHRGAVCAHSDRKLFPVRKKGRPRKTPAQETTRASSQQSQQSQQSCCSGSDCRCIHIEGELIESRGCACCGPGLAQQDLADSAFMAAEEAYSVPLQASRCCAPPASASSSTLPSTSCSSSSSLPSSSCSYSASSQAMSALPPASPQPTTVSPPPFKLRSPSRDTFAFDLPCTCPDPCPCPGCPSHSLTSSDVDNNRTKKKRSARQPGESCCATFPQFATKVSQDHCEGCLPCIIAPFEERLTSLDAPNPSTKKARTNQDDVQTPHAGSTCCATSSNVTLPPLYDGLTSQQRRLPPFAVVAAASPGSSTPKSQPSPPGANPHRHHLAGSERRHRSHSQSTASKPAKDESEGKLQYAQDPSLEQLNFFSPPTPGSTTAQFDYHSPSDLGTLRARAIAAESQRGGPRTPVSMQSSGTAGAVTPTSAAATAH